MRPPCFECGGPSGHDHHVIPKSLGGTKTVPLCVSCHGKVHGRDLSCSSLIKEGMERLRASGVALGRPKGAGAGVRLVVTPEQEDQVRRLKAGGSKVASIARATGLTRPTVYSILRAGLSRD